MTFALPPRYCRLLFPAAILLAVAVALAFRLPRLAQRPMHADEGINAVKFRDLYEHGRFRYDPQQFHGPTLYYCALPVAFLSRAASWMDLGPATYRLTTVIAGTAIILLLLLVRDGLGTGASACAAFLFAISPAFVFYSRYFIHEVPFTLFAFGAIAFGWRWWRDGGRGWAIAAGACFGLTHATKETCFILFVAMAIAIAAGAVWAAKIDGERFRPRPWLRKRHVTAGLVAAIVVSLLFYSSFFTNPHGVRDALAIFEHYVKRGSGETVHVQSDDYYLRLLAWSQIAPRPVFSEALILGLAAIGAVATLAGFAADRALLSLRRFVVFYTIVLLTGFSLIPYKTPWNVLVFHFGLVLLAGVGAEVLVRGLRKLPLQIAGALLLGAGAWQLGYQAYEASYVFDAAPRNPYVYAHTTHNAVDLVAKLEDLARLDPAGHNMVVVVATENYWPLPWYLRRFANVGYWDHTPTDADAPAIRRASVVITSPDLQDAVLRQAADPSAYATPATSSLRPDVVLYVYVRKELQKAYVAERTARRPKPAAR